jgi:hypothetical protein
MSVSWKGRDEAVRRTAEAPRRAVAAPVRELRDSLLLFALAASTLGAYVGLGLAAVKVLATK